MSEKKLNKIIEKVSIFSRVSPEHKVRILKALQRRGHIVAMTGDGVNDAPALKNSDIGVSMSITGTDVAKGAADMVLEDDNFATIVHAIEEGRSIYDNIRKFLHFLLMSNGAEVLIIFIAALIGMPLPLLAVQILWVNLLTDGLPAVALALDPPAIGIMNRNPRKSKENTISKSMIQSILFASVLMCIATLGLFKWVLYTGMPEAQARTVALAALIVLEMVSVQIVRGRYNVKWNSNKWVWLAILLSLGLMIAIIYLPVLQTLFHTVALPLSIWPWILGVSAIVYIVIIIKQIIERRFAK
jgi:Ca2+-transporting ATPase